MIDNDPTVVEQADLEGRNSLMWAAGKGSNDVIRVLLGLPAVVKTKVDEPLRSNGNSHQIPIEELGNHHNDGGTSPSPNIGDLQTGDYRKSPVGLHGVSGKRGHPRIKFSPVDINRADNKQNTGSAF